MDVVRRLVAALAATIATAAGLAGCGTARPLQHAAPSQTVHVKMYSGNGSVPAPSMNASRALAIAENKVGMCIEGFYGNQGFDNITPSYLGTTSSNSRLTAILSRTAALPCKSILTEPFRATACLTTWAANQVVTPLSTSRITARHSLLHLPLPMTGPAASQLGESISA